MPKRTQSYSAWQSEKLSDPSIAVGYLNSALAESHEMFLLALRKVAQSHQMAKVAKDANVQRETLYHALSENGNPTFVTLSAILEAVGLNIAVVNKKPVVKSRTVSSEEFSRPVNTTPSGWFRGSSTGREETYFGAPTIFSSPSISANQTTNVTQVSIGGNNGTAGRKYFGIPSRLEVQQSSVRGF
jgi:probable addiction module antidote protein